MYRRRGEEGEGEKYERGKEGKDYVREERVKREREREMEKFVWV